MEAAAKVEEVMGAAVMEAVEMAAVAWAVAVKVAATMVEEAMGAAVTEAGAKVVVAVLVARAVAARVEGLAAAMAERRYRHRRRSTPAEGRLQSTHRGCSRTAPRRSRHTMSRQHRPIHLRCGIGGFGLAFRG